MPPHNPETMDIAASATGISQLPVQRIFVGQTKASDTPLLLQTVLGSCVAVCLYHPVYRVGGMNHILFPGKSCGARNTGSVSGLELMNCLIDDMRRLGADTLQLVAKCFGAGTVLQGLQRPTVGDLNAQFVRAYLLSRSIPIVAERLGGTAGVQVTFQTNTGRATLHSLDRSPLHRLPT